MFQGVYAYRQTIGWTAIAGDGNEEDVVVKLRDKILCTHPIMS